MESRNFEEGWEPSIPSWKGMGGCRPGGSLARFSAVGKRVGVQSGDIPGASSVPRFEALRGSPDWGGGADCGRGESSWTGSGTGWGCCEVLASGDGCGDDGKSDGLGPSWASFVSFALARCNRSSRAASWRSFASRLLCRGCLAF